MHFRSPQNQSDFLEAAALQKLIIAAMKALTEKHPQEIASFLQQIFDRYNAANSNVQSEVAELIQHLKSLIADFDPSIPYKAKNQVQHQTRSTSRILAFTFAGLSTIAVLGTIGLNTIHQSTTIAPSLSNQPSATCTEVNPDRVYVNGYYRKDGRYVQPHERTTPNDTKADNLSCSR